MKIIDAQGKPCPVPVVLTKRAFESGESSVKVLVDNIVAVQNLEKMAKGFSLQIQHSNPQSGVFEVILTSDDDFSDFEEKKSLQKNDESFVKTVYLFGEDAMGSGDLELGKILLKGFIFSLLEARPLPEYLIFLNRGVFLTSKSSTVLEDLKAMEALGVGIITCGTCANYYDLLAELALGEINDMYEITKKLTEATKVISI